MALESRAVRLLRVAIGGLVAIIVGIRVRRWIVDLSRWPRSETGVRARHTSRPAAPPTGRARWGAPITTNDAPGAAASSDAMPILRPAIDAPVAHGMRRVPGRARAALLLAASLLLVIVTVPLAQLNQGALTASDAPRDVPSAPGDAPAGIYDEPSLAVGESRDAAPTLAPTAAPTLAPTATPTPTAAPAAPTLAPTPAPTAKPAAAPTPAPPASTHGPTVGVWLSRAELMALPTSGAAWGRLKAQADAGPGTPVDLSCQDSKHNTATMAVALVAARLDSTTYKAKVSAAIAAIIGTESGSSCGHGDRNRILGVGRNLASYVIAADLIDLRSYDPTLESRFRTWLSALRTKPPTAAYPTLTLAKGDATDAGNWGAYEAASRAAAAVYLGDTADIARSAEALRHFLTDGVGFTWSGDTSWACDPAHPTPINGSCSRDGHSLDGVIPMDMRRGGSYQWPPLVTQYPRENLVGRSIQAEILWRAGYATYDWGNRALLRASQRLLALDALDADWYDPQIHAYWLIRSHLGGLSVSGRTVGRGVSGVDWTHG